MLSVVSDLQVNLIVVARHRFVLTSFFPLLFFFTSVYRFRVATETAAQRSYSSGHIVFVKILQKRCSALKTTDCTFNYCMCTETTWREHRNASSFSFFFSSFYSFLVQFVLYSTWRLFFFFSLILTAISRHLSCSHKLCNAISCEVQLNVTLDPICFD